jgi:hypothetical protein
MQQICYIDGIVDNLSMPRNSILKQKRDQFIRDRFRYHRKKNPKWTIFAVIEEVAGEMFLSPVTVAKILKQSNEPKVPYPVTVSKRTKKAQGFI